jgi:hypothetical protein
MACECFQVLGTITFKISLGYFFYRIVNERWQRKALIGIVSISVLFGIAYFLFAVFQCGAPWKGETFWVKKITYRCASEAVIIGMGYPQSIINALTDIALCAMPIPMVWRAKFGRKDKIIVSGIMILAAAYLSFYSHSSKSFANHSR